MKRNTLLLLSLAALVSASAQDLQKEITVDRTVQPVLRESSRLTGVSPQVIAPQVSNKRLNTAEYTSPGKLTNEAAQLPPAPWRDSVDLTDYRGYASIGYFPALNIGANAGYRLIQRPNTNMGVWGQYNANSYKGMLPNYDDAPMSNSYICLGANGLFRSGTTQLMVDLDYTRASVAHPYALIEKSNVIRDKFNQSADIFNSHMRVDGNKGYMALYGGLGYHYFNFGECEHDRVATVLPSISQIVVDLEAGAGVAEHVGQTPWLGVDVDWGIMRSGGMEAETAGLTHYHVAWLSEGHLRPYLRFGEDTPLSGRLGVNISVATGNKHGHVRFAPDVEINWRPFSWASLYGKATGGEHLNRMSTLFDYNPYVNPDYGYERTNIALDARVGARLVPFNGLVLDAWAGYASGRGQLVPLIIVSSSSLVTSMFAPQNISSWILNASAEYNCNFLTLSVAAHVAGSNKGYMSWYRYYDASHLAGEVSLKIRPIRALEIEGGLDVRARRRCVMFNYATGSIGSFDGGFYSLGRIENVNVGAHYAINKQLTAFAFANNILNKRVYLISGYPAAGVTGLAGIAYKF